MTKRALSIQMGCLFLFVIVFFGYIILEEKGNPFMMNKSAKQIDAYAKKHFSDIIDNFQTEGVVYDKKNHTYYKKYVDKLSRDWSFTITYQKSKDIVDNYQESYVEGKSLKKAREKAINQTLKKTLKNLSNLQEGKLLVLLPLSEMTSENKTAFIQAKQLETLPVFTLSGTNKCNQITAIGITDHLKLLEEETKELSCISSFRITYQTKKEKITLTISKDQLGSPNLLGMIELALEKPRSAKEYYGILLEEE